MTGIVSYGAYVPYYRLPRSVIAKAWGQGGGSGEKAVARYDEDPVSMSVTAGMDCLKGFDPQSLDGLFLATTSAPYKERLNATIAATALNLGRQVRNADFANSLKAGTTALLSAADAVDAGRGQSNQGVLQDRDGIRAAVMGRRRRARHRQSQHDRNDPRTPITVSFHLHRLLSVFFKELGHVLGRT